MNRNNFLFLLFVSFSFPNVVIGKTITSIDSVRVVKNKTIFGRTIERTYIRDTLYSKTIFTKRDDELGFLLVRKSIYWGNGNIKSKENIKKKIVYNSKGKWVEKYKSRGEKVSIFD